MSWNVSYIGLILLSTIIDYTSAIKIVDSKSLTIKKLWLTLSLCSNLGILFLFKYFNFFVDSFASLFSIDNTYALNLLLPVGISFYTFQTMSYTIDVYRGQLKVEKDFFRFALFVSFFPQLVAGPIERARNILPQFRRKVEWNKTQIISGLELTVWGFFKKVVIADRLALLVNPVFNQPDLYGNTELLIAAYFFAFQIFCDFSAYSDIAIGIAKMLGFDLMENFRRPYFSKSIREFWSRWHISLSTWFRDYLYISLGGNRVPFNRHLLNLFIVFLISGLWHGANWTFVIWGSIHGLILIIEVLINKYKLIKNHHFFTPLKVIIVFQIVVVAWIFFRSNTVEQAFYILKKITDFKDYDISKLSIPISSTELKISLSTILLLILSQLVIERNWLEGLRKNNIVRSCLNFMIIILIFVLGVFNHQEFIYFQF